ncbi:unnamed protein product [Blepharisma stoltei]|uniref:Serine/threonine-protein phosphatase n=1 Tax=Blepharisma stoltei TaxID=1481888 RepID=A0AAU9J6S8_9CILI|nr:unnamed protein product [Blepharisma stoltei]
MDILPDPLNDRVAECPPPPNRPLRRDLLFPTGELTNADYRVLREHLSKEGKLDKSSFIEIIEQTTNLFRSEPNLLTLQDPVTIVGDIHGQYYDLMKLLDIGGPPDNRKYLFLGDYVDRGSFSIEVITYLYIHKIRHPTTFLMIRGNHECKSLTSFFQFRDECLYKYDIEVYDRIMDSFSCMPIACLVNKKFLAFHGGISPQLIRVDDISRIDRFVEIPRHGLFCDILWSDPIDNEEGKMQDDFAPNSSRGCSWYYGSDSVNIFLKRNGLLSIIRAHEVQLEGFRMHKWNGKTEFPSVITIFSAPNYCDVYRNKGAILKLDNNVLNILQFKNAAHPYLLPKFMDLFTWSIPFVIEKTLEILKAILKKKPKEIENLEEDSNIISEAMKQAAEERKNKLKNKIKSVSRMLKMFQTLRCENELIVKLKSICHDNKIPRGLLLEGKSAIETFMQAKELDKENEMFRE